MTARRAAVAGGGLAALAALLLAPANAHAQGAGRDGPGLRREREAFSAFLQRDPLSPRFAVARQRVPAAGLTLGPADTDIPLAGIERHRVRGAGTSVRLEAAGRPAVVVARGGVHRLGPWTVRVEVDAVGPVLLVYRAPGPPAPAPTWFAPDTALRAVARLVPPARAASVRTLGPDGREEDAVEAGTVTVRLGGATGTLTVRSFPGDTPEERQLLTYVRDGTSGAETYGAGRWVVLDPLGDGRVVLDMNRATNPFCAYSTAYPCPIPWRGNVLEARLTAGERYDGGGAPPATAPLAATPRPAPVASPRLPRVAGEWRAGLALEGGELRFGLRLSSRTGALTGELCNGADCQPLSAVRQRGDSVELEMADYAATLTARVSGDTLRGTYRNVGNRGPRTIPFTAVRGRWPASELPAGLAGRWDGWVESGFSQSARVVAFRAGPAGIEGTVITNAGDYGTFWGDVRGDSIAFQHFDGSFVYLLTVRLVRDSLVGTFHAGLRTRTAFRAWPSTGAPHLTPPTAVTVADTAPFRFAFRDLEGRVVTDADFRGQPLLVDLFGTWCPTCHEAAPTLAALHRRYGPRGLGVVGLAYEVTGDPAVDGALVRRYRDKHGIAFPLLLAGTNTTEAVQASQPQLANAGAFPTTLFIGRDGRVRRVHAGFYGPATGAQHARLVEEFEREVEALLAGP